MPDELQFHFQTVFTFASSDIEIMARVLELQNFFNLHRQWPALSLPDAETVPPPPRAGRVTGFANLRTEPAADNGRATILAELNVNAPPVEVLGEAGDYYLVRAYLWKRRVALNE